MSLEDGSSCTSVATASPIDPCSGDQDTSRALKKNAGSPTGPPAGETVYGRSAVRIRLLSAFTRPAGVAPYEVNDFSDAAIFLRPGCPSCDPFEVADVLSFAVVDSCRPSARNSLCSGYESRYATGLIRIIG